MAWVDKLFSMRIQIVDNGLNKITKTFKLTSADYATAITDATAVLAAFEAVCAAGTMQYTISQQWVNDALVVPASSAVQNEAKAVITCENSANPIKFHTISIPAPETDVFLATEGKLANEVNKAHGDVLDFVNLYDTAGECTLSDGESIKTNGIISGVRISTYKREG